MGASCAKGSKTTDPDKTPYQPTDKKKGKRDSGKPVEPDKAAVVEQRGSSQHERDGAAHDERRVPSPPQGVGDAEEGKKKPRTKSEDAKPRRTSDEPDQPRAASRSPSSEVTPLKGHQTERKRDSKDRPAVEQVEEEQQPKPKKRTHKDGKPLPPLPLLESSIDVEGSLETSRSTMERPPSESVEAPKRKPRTSHSKMPEEPKRHLDVEPAAEWKRSSLDNDVVVPVKVEPPKTSLTSAAASKNQTKEHEQVPADKNRKSGEEVTPLNRSKISIEEGEKRTPPDGLRESDVRVKVEGSRVTPNMGLLPSDWKMSETRTQRSEEVRTEEHRTLVIQSDGSGANRESLFQKREDLSPARKLRHDDFDMQPSGLTPVKMRISAEPHLQEKPLGTPNDAVVTSHVTSHITSHVTSHVTSQATSLVTAQHSHTSYRSSTTQQGIGKPVSPTRPEPSSPTGGKGEPTMAIFDALKGLKSQKGGEQGATPTQQVIDPPPPTHSTVTAASQLNSSSSVQPTSAATVSTTPEPTATSPTTVTSPRATDGQSHSPPDRPVPAVRTTILLQQQQNQPTTTEPNKEAKEDKRITTNGIDISRPGKDDEAAKSKQEQRTIISKLPVKGAGSTSPVTSPPPSASVSLNLSSAAPSPASPSSTTPSQLKSAEAEKVDSAGIDGSSSLGARRSETRKLLVDLSRENEALVDAYNVCPNTRTKLLQAIDRWFTGNDKDRENTPSRVMAISGRPGIGKTCLTAELSRRYANQLGGSHFFQFYPCRLDQNFASTLLLSVAWRLGEVLPGYSAHLPLPEELCSLLTEGGELVKLFDVLISRPLQKLSSDKPLLIIIDAVDECCPSDRDFLLQVINGFGAKTPDWLYLLCTIRDDNQMTAQLDAVHVIEVKGTSDAMTTDIKRYLRDPMSRLIDRISLDGALTQLTNHSQGSFLAAYLIRRKLEKYPEGTALALRDVTLFPTGLADIIKEFFQRFYDQLGKKFSPKELPVMYGGILGILVTAREKLNTSFVKQVHASLNPDEDLVPLQGLLDTDDGGSVGFHHKSISEWLLSEQAAAPLAVNITNARQKMADVVLNWLAPILDDSSSNSAVNVPAQLRQYALKNAMEHLTDVPKQQDSIAGLLCSLSYIEKKLKVPDVTLADLRRDYNHSHYQATAGTASKLITLEGYIKRFTNLTEQIEAYDGFIRRRGDQIARYPKFLLQFAANYPTVTRIQDNARIDLSDKPWLEDVTAAAETPCITKSVKGCICHSDISNDNKTVAVLTQDEQKVFLSLLNIASGEIHGEPIDLSNIPDRRGLCIRFLPDNNLLFVGSLSTFVSVKNGKPAPSGLDVQSVQVKEKYTVECCDAVNGTLACGINTLPWGGRSLHMIVFDLKLKTAKTLEVLKFRFGGSAQFGIKACALSLDGSQLSACSKQTNKNDMKVTVYSTGNLNSLYSIDVENDAISRCFFVGDQSLLMCGGTGTPELYQQTYLWSFQEKQVKCLLAGSSENCSVAQLKNTQLTLAHCSRFSPQVTVSRWKKDATKEETPYDRHVLQGLDELSDMYATEKSLVFVSKNCIRILRMADMTVVEAHPTSGSFALHDAVIEGISFFPRSDESIVVHRSAMASLHDVSGAISASRVSVKNDGALLGAELFSDVPVSNSADGKRPLRPRCFQGAGSAVEISSSTPDGSIVIINSGSDVKVLEVSSGNQRSLPKFAELTKVKKSELENSSSPAATVTCVLSSKESLAGVSYPEKPESLFVFDLKSKTADPALELRLDPAPAAPITDFAFIPTNGYVISYHKASDQSLVVWNQRNGTQVSKQTDLDVVYVRSSPSSDRLVVSLRRGSLVLRNSDNRFNISLELVPVGLVPETGCGDVEFAADGTVLVGMFVEAKAIRIWNGGNGETLKDLNFGFIGSYTELVGMVTNTHALFNDGSMLYVCDVDSGDVISVIHSAQRLANKHGNRGLRISPKGSLIAGSTERGAELRLFLCHNLSSVKRKTSLQIIRSK